MKNISYLKFRKLNSLWKIFIKKEEPSQFK
jgi:hypothetical protein